MSHTRLVVIMLAASTVVAAGCGGSKTTSSQSKASVPAEQSAQTQQSSTQAETTPTESTAAGKPLVRTALVAKADAICKRLNTQTKSVSISSIQDFASTAPRLAAYYRSALADLHKLTPPAAIASDWKTMAIYIQMVVNEIATEGKYAADKDPASVARVDKNITNIQRQRFAIAKRYGIKDCAEL